MTIDEVDESIQGVHDTAPASSSPGYLRKTATNAGNYSLTNDTNILTRLRRHRQAPQNRGQIRLVLQNDILDLDLSIGRPRRLRLAGRQLMRRLL